MKRIRTFPACLARVIQSVLLGLMCILLYIVAWSDPASAVETSGLPTQIQTTGTGEQLLMPDWSAISLSNMPPIQSNGSITIDGELVKWQRGQTPDQFFRIGDLAPALGAENLTLGAVAESTRIDIEQIALSAFTLAAKQQLGHLVTVVPKLANRLVSEVPPIRDVIKTIVGNQDGTIAQVLKNNPAIATQKLGSINLSQYPISSIPNLDAASFKDFQDWQPTKVSGVPGLGDLPLNAFPQPLDGMGNVVARIDMIYGTGEAKRDRAISGSYQQGFSVACGSRCAYIELDDLENSGRNTRGSFEGKQWISGKYQTVNGGEGCLAGVNGGKEPTGRHPFGSLFKVVVMEPNEQTDRVNTALYFRFSTFCGSSPYILGPIPFFSYTANSPIFVGAPDWQETSTGMSAPTNAQIGETASDLGNLGENDSLFGKLLALCSGKTVQGLNLDGLAQAIAAIESRGNGGYNAVGVYTCADGGRNCGRGLGKYQFMSYNEYAADLISARSDGQVFLRRVERGYQPTSADLMQYFPPEDQDRAFQNSLADKLTTTAREIDPKTEQPFTGDRLLERVAQKHFGGDYSAVDGGSSDASGQLSLAAYGTKARTYYKSNGKGNCQTTALTKTKAIGKGSSKAVNGVNTKITNTTKQLFGMNTSAGPDGGANACAWTVNKVLAEAGIRPLGANPNYVPSVVDDLRANRGQKILAAQAKAGDIIIAKDQRHIGICLKDGCSEVLSNSSSRASFRWKSSRTFDGAYDQYGGSEEIYRVTK
ncbi:M23 family peptidase [Phormidesmis sp. 146-35]